MTNSISSWYGEPSMLKDTDALPCETIVHFDKSINMYMI